MDENKNTVLIISPQAGRNGHGALHGQRTIAAFAELGEWKTIFLTGNGFRNRSGDQPLFGQLIESPIDFNQCETYQGVISSIRWGIRRRTLQKRLFALVDHLIKEYPIDVVLVLDGDVSIIHNAWKRSRRRNPRIAWVIAHSTLDFWFTGFSIRSIFKWYAGKLVKRMVEGMGATILYTDENLKSEFLQRLNISKSCRKRIILSDFGCDSGDLRIARRQAREKLGIPVDANVALFFGIIRDDKRPDLAIAAIAKAKPIWWLLMAGQPYSYSPDQIKRMIREAGLADRSTLKLCYLDENDISLVYSAADVLLMTHERRTLSNSGILSLARSFRLPVIINKNSPLGRSVEKDGTGTTCEDGQATSVAGALDRFSNLDPQGLGRMISNIDFQAEQHSFLMTVKSYSQALAISISDNDKNNEQHT